MRDAHDRSMESLGKGHQGRIYVKEDTMSRSTLSSPMFLVGDAIALLMYEWSSNNNMKKKDRGRSMELRDTNKDN
jgi:hypothetical protein